MPVNNAVGTGGAALAAVWSEALASIIEDIHDALEHVTSIFPSDTNLTCTWTANASANTWSGWTEITDGSTTLSSLLTSAYGHITSMVIENVGEVDTVYMFEIAYGGSHIVITRGRFAGETKFQRPNNQKRFWAPAVPAGETVYYRLKTATAVADACEIHLRYHLD